MKRAPIALTLALAFALTGARAADLIGVYRDALGHDAQFASARALAAAGREALPQARAGLLPTIAASANTQRNDVDYERSAAPSFNVSQKYNSNGWTVSISQPLFRWDRIAGYSQGQARVAQADARFALARQDLALRATQGYFDVLQAQEALSAAQASKQAISEQLEEAKRSFEVGTKTIVDVRDAQARFDLAVAQEIAATNDLAVKNEQLRVLTGKRYDNLKNLKSGVPLPQPQPNTPEPWVSGAEQSYYGVQAARFEVDIRQQEIEKQRAGHLPALDLVAARSRAVQGNNVVTFTGSETTSSVVGLQLAIPLYSGGAVSSLVAEAVALRDQAAADLDNAQRNAALQARQSFLGVSAGLSQVKALEAALVSSQSALDSNKLGFEVGVRTNIDVLNAQSQYFDTRQRLVRARLDTLAALLHLKYAAGTLSDEDIEAINGLLE